MPIGEVIRTYRKQKGLTQEAMANRLGVTTPAVNKWENGNSMPDITLLAPIARLLDISLDTLLSFREALTNEEIMALINEFDERAKRDGFEPAHAWAVEQMRAYPNCDLLTLRMAQQFHISRTLYHAEHPEQYDADILDCYERVLRSADEPCRQAAAGCLFSYYLQKEAYEKAESYLAYYAEKDPLRQWQQALICSKTDRKEEACRLWEQLLFSSIQTASMALDSLLGQALAREEMTLAHDLADKRSELSRIMDMGEYNQEIPRLELALHEKDVEGSLRAMERLISSVTTLDEYSRSPLYPHLHWKPLTAEFAANLQENLRKSFLHDEATDFLRDDPRLRALTEENP